ncbi:MAG: DUF1697 domain-containing protein [Actinomycetota bacterium]
MGRYVALLRGINVGGKNLIKMADLKASFEEGGFENVATYIASGNVIFESSERSAATLTKKIETLLSARFKKYEANVVVRSKSQMRSILEKAPKGFGAQPARFRSDVLFLKPPFKAAGGRQGHSDKGGRGSGVRRTWGALPLALDEQGNSEPSRPDLLLACVQEHDHPKLEHHGQARGADGRQLRVALLLAVGPVTA